MAGELLKMLQERNRRRQPLPFATARQDETARAARVPYKTGSGGEFRDDLMKVAKEAYEWSPLATIEDLYKAYKDPSLENVGWAALGAIPGGKPAKKIGGLAKNLLKANRAAKAKKVYQGTPHTLEAEPGAPLGRLKDEFIGTGEGAAAYGRGHYVAEEPDVGRFYRDSLVQDADLRVGGRPIYDEYKRLEDAAMKLPAKEAGKHYDKMSAVEDLMVDGDITSLRDRAKLGSYTDETVEYIEKELAPKFTRKGNVYEMALKTADEDFLLWDRPLAKQSQKIQKLINQQMPKNKANKIIDKVDRLAEKSIEEFDRGISFGPKTKAWEKAYQSDDYALAKFVTDPRYTGDRFYHGIGVGQKSIDVGPKTLSNKFNIRGIKYLDQSSRGAGKGTSNFVVFDPKDLEILRILGLAGVAVGSAGLMGRASSNEGQTVQ